MALALPSRLAPWILVAGSLVFAIVAGLAFRRGAPEAGPGRFAADATLARLEPGAQDADRRLLRALHDPAAGRPPDPAMAVALARREILAWQESSDPRHLSYAQAALGPFWEDPSPPPEVRLLRASIRQSFHAFEPAKRDLLALLAEDPENVQGLLTLSVVQLVGGELPEAAKSCARLEGRVSPVIHATCAASVEGLQGRSAEGLARVEAALATAADPAEKTWGRGTVAELQARLGKSERAVETYRELERDGALNDYARGAFADLLIDLGRLPEATALVKSAETDGALLRRAILEARGEGGVGVGHAEAMRERVAESRARREKTHLREEARFFLEVERDGAEALRVALENFEIQKEPWDVRLVLEAALLAGQPGSAGPALSFAARTGLEEPSVVKAARTLALVGESK